MRRFSVAAGTSRARRAALLPALLALLAPVLSSCGDAGDAGDADDADEARRAPPPAEATAVGPARLHRAAAEHLVVACAGAFDAGPDAPDREAARALAERIAAASRGAGASLAEALAAAPAAEREAAAAGFFGIVRRGQLSDDFRALEEALFALEEGEVSAPIATPLGFQVLRRVPIREWSAAHILIRHRDSRDPPGLPPQAPVERDRAEAERIARELLARIRDGADFDDIARRRSEALDRHRGGALGIAPAGRLAAPIEAAIAALAEGGIGGPVETEFGFHIVRRLAIERALVRTLRIECAAAERPAAWARLEALRDGLAAGLDGIEASERAHRIETRFIELERELWAGPGAFPPAGVVHDVVRGAFDPDVETLALALPAGGILGPLLERGGGAVTLWLRVE